MKVIQGILSSGSGEELYEARRMLENAKKMTPDGGEVLPVSFQPANWFEHLDNSFMPTDLLESTEAISVQIRHKAHELDSILDAIAQINSALPSDDQIRELKEKFANAKQSYSNANSKVAEAYTSGLNGFAGAIVQISAVISNAIDDDKKREEAAKKASEAMVVESGVDDKNKVSQTISGIFSSVIGNTANIMSAQESLVSAAINLTDAAGQWTSVRNAGQLAKSLIPLNSKVKRCSDELDELRQLLQLRLSNASAASGNNASPAPVTVPKGFTNIYISSADGKSFTSEVKTNTTTRNTRSTGFWFFGGSKTTTSTASTLETVSKSRDFKIEIGMSVAKVGITRNWFNPGIFALSKNMFSVSGKKIAIGPLQFGDGNNPNIQTQLQNINDTIFPCFPVAFIVARDITIKVSVSQSGMEAFAKLCEEHSGAGGGFLFFNGSSAQSSSSSQSSTSVETHEDSLTIRFTDPQIIGYYLHFTANDESRQIPMKSHAMQLEEVADDENETSFLDFVQKLQEIIIDANAPSASRQQALSENDKNNTEGK
jgi:hypothetical protein